MSTLHRAQATSAVPPETQNFLLQNNQYRPAAATDFPICVQFIGNSAAFFRFAMSLVERFSLQLR
ncbi:hypothetical protein [Planctopirus hydrillae]|uniref:Uncharacterized protein n=1 Tax=Planctopirus hydrillae TaxID=1841610 RepID=A0A1C3ENS5_9PLAN|nr:hypothetical protein [Planctopirus hydrillae]ODA34891.1 hypothetical protein A6X21_04385 [Planctopirus hydrillae]